MNIIEKGKIPNSVQRFTCRYCKTIFEADSTEYKAANQMEYIHDDILYKCRCPVCGRYAYLTPKEANS